MMKSIIIQNDVKNNAANAYEVKKKSKYNGDNKKDAISDVFQVETGTNNFDSFLKLTILTGHYL
ncbi:MAG: hypothetical protein PUH11_04395 [Bacilli bacterium]|nr:hypothetical protein [Bacilli bacterium]